MIFSSLSFIFRFLPVFLLIYIISPKIGKNFVLLVGSLIFYALGEPVYVFLMMGSILFNYLMAIGITHFEENPGAKKILITSAVFYNVGLLVFFKYVPFVVRTFNDITGLKLTLTELTLPIGISFFTFQSLSYVVDVYRGTIACEDNIIDLGAYLGMFPMLMSGPIVMYRNILDTIKNPDARVRLHSFEEGIRLFTLGLGSKVLVADRLGQLWNTMSEVGYSQLSTPAAWIGIVAYTLQIYFDFNGYTLMAVGIGRMLGFEFPRNFNQPYTAVTVSDFWKRWHITLTSFFREYVYIPLGGNRAGLLKMFRNMLVVWLLTGLWHGADWNFIIWGVYYFVFIAIERLIKISPLGKLNINRFFVVTIPFRIYTLIVVMVGWAIFAINNLGELWAYIMRLFAPAFDLSIEGMGIESFTWFMYIWIAVGVLLATPLFKKLYEKIEKTPIGAILLMVIFWTSVVQLVDGAYNPFIYFRF